jgi:DNA-binding response OmpR family regulator
VALAFDGEQALDMEMAGGLNVLVLDAMLPTIMVTARDAMCDIVRGLTKPFALDVLLARVRALLRRGPATFSDDLQIEDLRLKCRIHELQRGNRVAALTRTESALMEMSK